MGYYSSVYIACNKKLADKIRAVSKTPGYVVPKISVDEGNEYFLFTWEWIKWYSGGSDDIVTAVKNLLNDPEDDEAYAFLRTGESSEDVEFESMNVDGTPLESVYPITTLDSGDLNFSETTIKGE